MSDKSKKFKISVFFKQLIYPTCLFYTILTIAFYSIGTLFDRADTKMIPTLETVLLILGFSLLLNIANIILRQKKLGIAFRIVIHYIFTGVSFYVIFIALSSYKAGTSVTILLLLCYTLIYFAVCGLYFLFTGIKKKSENEASDYKPVYKK